MTDKMNRFLVSTELECQNILAGEGTQEETFSALSKFLQRLPSDIPCLCDGGGWFTPYGRFYLDCGHLELAAIECDDPYFLPRLLERMQLLCRRVIANLEPPYSRLRLANNNHSGLLQHGGPTWGSHENYAVETPPPEFTRPILPFLATRFYGGAGGVQAATGNFIASVRAEFIQHETGGSTTDARALHSTCRNEHHVDPRTRWYRYHQLLGDGKRSHYNIALQFAATALALKAMIHDDGYLAERLRAFDHAPADGSWVNTLKELNVLARPGGLLRVDPRVITIQRTYLEASRRFVASLKEPPAWTARALTDWDDVLTAAAEGEHGWLAARLDAFAKYQLFTSYLHAGDHDWLATRRNQSLLAELALLDHGWHDFTSPDSTFEQGARAGLLDHRVGELVEPGGEEEPWIPEVKTRAKARARFIVEHAGNDSLYMDWGKVVDCDEEQRRTLGDPFAEAFGPWQQDVEPSTRPDFLERMRMRRRARS